MFWRSGRLFCQLPCVVGLALFLLCVLPPPHVTRSARHPHGRGLKAAELLVTAAEVADEVPDRLRADVATLLNTVDTNPTLSTKGDDPLLNPVDPPADANDKQTSDQQEELNVQRQPRGTQPSSQLLPPYVQESRVASEEQLSTGWWSGKPPRKKPRKAGSQLQVVLQSAPGKGLPAGSWSVGVWREPKCAPGCEKHGTCNREEGRCE
jgi:hypothetical protein